MSKATVESVIINRLASKIGFLEGALTESQVYNEVLVEQNKALREELEELRSEESGGSEDEEEGE